MIFLGIFAVALLCVLGIFFLLYGVVDENGGALILGIILILSSFFTTSGIFDPIIQSRKDLVRYILDHNCSNKVFDTKYHNIIFEIKKEEAIEKLKKELK